MGTQGQEGEGGMDVNRVAHDARRYERVDQLLDDDRSQKRHERGNRADEQAHQSRNETSQPRPDDRNDVEDPRDDAQCRRALDSQNGEQHAAASADNGALDGGSHDVAAHDPGGAAVEHLQIVGVLGTEHPTHLGAQIRKIDQHPKCNDQRESHGNEDVRNRGSRRDDGSRTRPRKRGRPIDERRRDSVDRALHLIVLEEIGVARIQVVEQVVQRPEIVGDVCHQIGELIADADLRGKDHKRDGPQPRKQQKVGNRGSDQTRNPSRFKEGDRGAQKEHEHDGPQNDADGNGDDDHGVDRGNDEDDGPHPGPHGEEPALRLNGAQALAGGLVVRLALQRQDVKQALRFVGNGIGHGNASLGRLLGRSGLVVKIAVELRRIMHRNVRCRAACIGDPVRFGSGIVT